MKPFVCGLMVTLACLVSRPASAESILFTGTGAGASSVMLDASALFDISGTTLTITLSNLGDTSGKVLNSDTPNNQLSGLFFDLPDGITLTPVSATINPNSIVQAGSCNAPGCNGSTTNVGGEFRYATGSYPNSADRGISSGGQTGSIANFNGPELDDPAGVNGMNFLIIAPQTGNNLFWPDSNLVGQPLVEGSVEFAMTISGGTIHASDLANVSFQYGSAEFSGSNIVGNRAANGQAVPEPMTSFLALSGIAIAVRRSRSRGHQA